MKFYVWSHNLEALSQFSCGSAFVMAESKEDAIRLIVQKFKGSGVADYKPQEIKVLKEELESKEPAVYEKNHAEYVYGSE